MARIPPVLFDRLFVPAGHSGHAAAGMGNENEDDESDDEKKEHVPDRGGEKKPAGRQARNEEDQRSKKERPEDALKYSLLFILPHGLKAPQFARVTM